MSDSGRRRGSSGRERDELDKASNRRQSRDRTRPRDVAPTANHQYRLRSRGANGGGLSRTAEVSMRRSPFSRRTPPPAAASQRDTNPTHPQSPMTAGSEAAAQNPSVTLPDSSSGFGFGTMAAIAGLALAFVVVDGFVGSGWIRTRWTASTAPAKAKDSRGGKATAMDGGTAAAADSADSPPGAENGRAHMSGDRDGGGHAVRDYDEYDGDGRERQRDAHDTATTDNIGREDVNRDEVGREDADGGIPTDDARAHGEMDVDVDDLSHPAMSVPSLAPLDAKSAPGDGNEDDESDEDDEGEDAVDGGDTAKQARTDRTQTAGDYGDESSVSFASSASSASSSVTDNCRHANGCDGDGRGCDGHYGVASPSSGSGETTRSLRSHGAESRLQDAGAVRGGDYKIRTRTTAAASARNRNWSRHVREYVSRVTQGRDAVDVKFASTQSRAISGAGGPDAVYAELRHDVVYGRTRRRRRSMQHAPPIDPSHHLDHHPEHHLGHHMDHKAGDQHRPADFHKEMTAVTDAKARSGAEISGGGGGGGGGRGSGHNGVAAEDVVGLPALDVVVSGAADVLFRVDVALASQRRLMDELIPRLIDGWTPTCCEIAAMAQAVRQYRPAWLPLNKHAMKNQKAAHYAAVMKHPAVRQLSFFAKVHLGRKALKERAMMEGIIWNSGLVCEHGAQVEYRQAKVA